MPRPLTPAAELLRRVAEIHDRPSGAVRVIRVLVDANSDFPLLVQRVCEIEGGAILETDAIDSRDPFGATPPGMTLAAAVRQSLTLSASWSPRTFEVAHRDGQYFANYTELGETGATSEADQRLLSLGAAALDPGLGEGSIAVIRYREAGLDLHARRGAWELGHQLNQLRIGALRTLVFIAEIEGDPDVMLHCGHLGGFRFAHVGDVLLERHEPDRLAYVANMLTSKDPLVLYLGAGFSASSNLPMGNSLRNSAMAEMLGADAQGLDSLELSERMRRAAATELTDEERGMSPEEFERQLTFERVTGIERQNQSESGTLVAFQARAAEVLNQPSSLSVEALHRIIRSGRRLIVVTVNLDELVEHDLGDLVQVFSTDAEFGEAAQYVADYRAGAATAVPVLKLHGTISDLSSCVVTIEQTRVGLSPPKHSALAACIGSKDEPLTWVYVGASMRDLDVNRDLFSLDFAKGISDYWVAPMLIPTVAAFGEERKQFWARPYDELQKRLITESSDIFMSALAREWGVR